MGVQQLIANNTNILLDASVIASTVTPSTDISRTAITRQGTGLAELSGLYTGHTDATFDIEIVAGDGNGRASTPQFSGVGSGTLAVTAAALPAQDISITLLTPPFPGATAEARIGSDIIKAKSVGTGGNLIQLQVNRSGLTFTASGSSTLEEIAEGDDELTNYKWDIPGVVCSADQSGNVPADAPRVRFGTDPAVYRIVKDSRSGSLQTILSPAAVRPIPAGSPIWIVTGSYSVVVTNGTTTETYSSITTTYSLLSALLASTLVEPAYTPAPVTTIGGNAVTDIPLVTGATALLTNSSSTGVRPLEISARSTALADTIRLASRGNGTWSVSGASGTIYTDAFEGQLYAPADSPVLLTIPAKPQAGNTSTQPVYISDTQYASREDNEDLPLFCINGALGKNAVPKTITATYARRPDTDGCPCPTTNGWFNSKCLGLDISNLQEDIMSLDPAYQTRLVALYEWQKSTLESEWISAPETSWLINGRDRDTISSVTQIMADTLAQVWGDSAGLDAYDDWTEDLQGQLVTMIGGSTVPAGIYTLASFTAVAQSGANAVLAAAGIVPGKLDTVNGSTGCWQDDDGQYWWMLSDGYAPAFTAVEYYSTRAGSFENTQEFAFYIKCGCPDRIKEGDRLEITIGAGMASINWSSNEYLEITTIPTTPLYLAGGLALDDSETWAVSGKDSSNAALPEFNADTLNRSYSSGGLEFTLAAGGIPFNVGDRFSFTVEGGTFKWRKDAGAWSANTAIADNTLLDSGLYVDFTSGPSPSFVTGDSFSFKATQTFAPTLCLAPGNDNWQWADATATLTLTLSTPSTLSTISLLHSLPAGAAIAVDYSLNGSTFLPLAWASGVVRDYLHVVSGADVEDVVKLRITVDDPGAIRWLWAGVPLQPIYSGAVRIRKQYDMLKAKISGSASMLARGTGATIEWDFLDVDDADAVLNMVDYVKSNGDQPVIMIPQHLHPEEWCIGRLADDGIEINDLLEYQPDDTTKRILSGSMELVPEWR